MPNYCNYSMCVKCTKENVEEFVKVIKADYDYNNMQFTYHRHMFRVFEAECNEIEEIDCGVYRTIINGYCAWSVATCMLEDGYYRDNRKKFGINSRGTTLIKESDMLNLEIEVFSEECGCCFQEHYVFDNGEVLCDDCVDYEEYWFDDYETKEEAEEELEIDITDEEWVEGFSSCGGFSEWSFDI